MENISIEDLSENSLFHFTHNSNLENINSDGILPKIGENATGIERTEKTFFSKGELGVLKASEVWLRWLMNRIFGVSDRLGLYKDESFEDRQKRLREWTHEFLEGNYLEDSNKKEVLFEYFYNYLKERTYLVLDIEENKDYFLADEDENKVNLVQMDNKITTDFAKVMYGPFSNMETTTMDDWNMHTITGTTIPKERIKQVTTPDGKTDMLSIVLYIYSKYKDMSHDRLLLDDFIEYAKKKQALEEMLKGEEKEDDQINYSRIN